MRERWFYVQGGQRSRPLSFTEVVAALRGEPDPRSVLVWRKGLRQWTLAETVPEIRQQLQGAPAAGEALRSELAAAEVHAAPSRTRSHATPLGIAALALLAGLLVVVRLRSSEPRVSPKGPEAPLAPVAPRVSSAPVAAGDTLPPATAARVRATAKPPGAPALAADETDLPGVELRKLRAVAAWSGETLKLTVYNATAWRVTELHVRIERFGGEDFVADERPTTLVPQSQRVDAGVADLLARVAPDRKRPGLNSLDTGVFEARAGAAPEGFRFELESARGYPPQR